jgi:hypothetical protein
VKITARAKRIPNWQLDRRGLVEEVIESPVRSSEPEETIALIPMGAARLRITAFPVIGDGADARDWPKTPRSAFDLKASHCFAGDTTDSLFDAGDPKQSHDTSIPRFTWWDHRGSDEWIEVGLKKANAVSALDVYWYDDTGAGSCRVPASWRLLYRQGNEWKPVQTKGSFGVKPDQFNRIKFTVVTTDALRLEVKLQPDFSGGILRIRMP